MLHTRGWHEMKLGWRSFGKGETNGEVGVLDNLHTSRYLRSKTEKYGERLGYCTNIKWKCQRKKTQTDAEAWWLQIYSCNNIRIWYVMCGDCTVMLKGDTSWQIGVSEATMRSPVPQKWGSGNSCSQMVANAKSWFLMWWNS
jgi:hypothetical protein